MNLAIRVFIAEPADDLEPNGARSSTGVMSHTCRWFCVTEMTSLKNTDEMSRYIEALHAFISQYYNSAFMFISQNDTARKMLPPSLAQIWINVFSHLHLYIYIYIYIYTYMYMYKYMYICVCFITLCLGVEVWENYMELSCQSWVDIPFKYSS